MSRPSITPGVTPPYPTHIYRKATTSQHPSPSTKHKHQKNLSRINLKTPNPAHPIEMAFPRFNDLPLELQLKIWSYALRSPQIVNVCALIIAHDQFFDRKRVVTKGRRRKNGGFIKDTYRWETESLGCKERNWLYASPVPDAFETSRLLYVNREARNLVLRRCGRITVNSG